MIVGHLSSTVPALTNEIFVTQDSYFSSVSWPAQV